MLLLIIGKQQWRTVQNEALSLYTAPVNRFSGTDCSTIVQLNDAHLAGTVRAVTVHIRRKGELLDEGEQSGLQWNIA